MQKYGLALATLLLGAAPVLRADSEGYYCAGPGYVAYELRGFQFFDSQAKTPPKHMVHLVTLGNRGEISDPIRLEIPDFQVQAMHCTAEAVELLSFDSVYDISLRKMDKPQLLYTRRLKTPGDTPPGFESHWMLGNKSLADRVRPLWESPDHIHYVLMVSVSPGPKRCTQIIDDRIVGSSADGKAWHDKEIYHSLYPTECGE